jgi:uncharacterized protein YfaS (alpha-2-macroglobulin family)
MKNLLLGGMLTVLVVFGGGLPHSEKNQATEKAMLTIRQLWREVNQAKADGLPRSAVAKLEQIVRLADNQGLEKEWLLALSEKIFLEGSVEGNRPEERIRRLQAGMAKAGPRTRPLLLAVLASWYRHYFEANRWRFLQRSGTQDMQEDDFTTWDLCKIFGRIDSLYDEALRQKDLLQEIPIEAFLGFLEPGTLPVGLRPTLYDFLAHEALDFYCRPEQAGAAPQDAFVLEAGSAALAPLDEFLRFDPQSSDTGSHVLKAIRLFQELLVFRKGQGDADALTSLDLDRLRYTYNTAVGEDRRERFRQRLDEIRNAQKQTAITALADFYLASSYEDEGALERAHALARSGEAKFPGSLAAQSCRALQVRIEAKTVRLQAESSYLPTGGKIAFHYRNFRRLHFRVVPDSWAGFMKKDWGSPFQPEREEIERLLDSRPVASWKVDLPETADFREKAMETRFPALAPGYYRIFASWQSDFANSSQVAHAGVFVSSIMLVTTVSGREVAGLVFKSESGEPVAGAEVSLLRRQDRHFHFVSKRITDGNGMFAFAKSDRYYEQYLHVHHERDEMLGQDAVENYRSSEEVPERQVVFFTDRSLYRPGQAIHFKGIAVQVDLAKDDYRLLPGTDLNVRFLDSNGQEIASQAMRSNDFGSISGTFTAPGNLLTGQMRIECAGLKGRAYVRVEEYKRPKFEVSLEKPAGGVKLGERVTVLGKALNYSGAAVDGSPVRFRVRRQARYPYWYYWFNRNPRSSDQEIAHGTLSTGSDGEFAIVFQALPDRRVDEKDDPTFIFTIHAEVVDAAGETRTAAVSILVGYSALALRLEAPSMLEEGRKFTLQLQGLTLDGLPQGAAGTVRVDRLRQPDEPVSADLWPTDGPAAQDWSQWPAAGTQWQGEFRDADGRGQSLPLELACGFYRVEASARDVYGRTVKAMLPLLVLAPRERKRFPLKLASLVKVNKDEVRVGETLELLWGTGFQSGRCFIEIECRDRVIDRFWSDRGATQQLFKLPVGERFRGGLTVHCIQVSRNRAYIEEIPIAVPWDNKELLVETASFRSKLLPGEQETIKIRVRARNGSLKMAELAAAMYDLSLDQFLGHSWEPFDFFRREYSRRQSWANQRAVDFNAWRETWNEIPVSPLLSHSHFPEIIIRRFLYYEFADGAVKRKGVMSEPEAAMAGAIQESVDIVAAAPALEKAKSARAAHLPADLSKQDTEKDKRGGADGGQAGAAALQVRRNLQETAFFHPQLLIDEDGAVTISCTMPESLTKWKLLAFAHSRELQSGVCTAYTVTQKELMVTPNPPRFLREGDRLQFAAKVANLSDSEQKGVVQLDFSDLLGDQGRNQELGLADSRQEFKIAAHSSQGFFWELRVPRNLPPLRYTVSARSKAFSDGEAGALPVLSSRIMVSESLPLSVRGPQRRKFVFERLKELQKADATLEPLRLTVQMSSNPAWYAIQALPYLIEYTYECSEQVFNRYYGNLLAAFIADSDPRIRQVFDSWRGGDALKSNLEKNPELKSALLQETPWVLQARNESQAKENVGLLFEKNTLRANLESALGKLKQQQLGNGAFPWFPGGRPDPFITLYIMTGCGRLQHLGVPVEAGLGRSTLSFLDGWIRQVYDQIKNRKMNHLNSATAFYLYGRSFFLEKSPIPAASKAAVDYFLEQSRAHWLTINSRLSQAQLALALLRFGSGDAARKIVASIKERSVTDAELGRFWREDELSHFWYRAPIESQAMMIEAFAEISADEQAVEECRIWLLKQKETQAWHSTKATADAIYALILRGGDWLSASKTVPVWLGELEVRPERVEAGTGYYEKAYGPDRISAAMAEVTIQKEEPGIAWGGVHFQYLEEMGKVTPHQTSLKLEKRLFVERNGKAGPVIEPVSGPLRPGDLLVNRIVLRTDRDMEYVHLKDLRGSGLEPVDVLSGYRYQDGLAYYQSTRDTASHFFIDYLPKGTYVFEYRLRVQLKGRYQTGVAEIQSMYAPAFNAHSESLVLEVQ